MHEIEPLEHVAGRELGGEFFQKRPFDARQHGLVVGEQPFFVSLAVVHEPGAVAVFVRHVGRPVVVDLPGAAGRDCVEQHVRTGKRELLGWPPGDLPAPG